MADIIDMFPGKKVDQLEENRVPDLSVQIETQKGVVSMRQGDWTSSAATFRAVFGVDCEYYKPNFFEKSTVSKFIQVINDNKKAYEAAVVQLAKLQDQFYATTKK